MKVKIILLSVIALMSALMTGCILNKEVVIPPEQLEEMYSLKSWRCETNLSIFFYRKYRINNHENGESFYLNKDGELRFIIGKTSRGNFGRIRDKEIIADKICELKELFQVDMDLIKNESNSEEILGDLTPLDSSFIKSMLSEPQNNFAGFSGKICGDLIVSIMPSSIFCFYEIGDTLSYIEFDKKGNLLNFSFSNFGNISILNSSALDSLAKKYSTKEFYYLYAETSQLIYINKEREASFDYVYCLPPEEIEKLRWKITMIEMFIKMDLILHHPE